jgi:hypothetical protein
MIPNQGVCDYRRPQTGMVGIDGPRLNLTLVPIFDRRQGSNAMLPNAEREVYREI